MQNTSLHSPGAPPNHSPVTRLIASLKETNLTEEDKLSRRQTLSATLGFLLALLGLGLFALYERYSAEAWLVWVSMMALGGGTAWSVVFAVFGGREVLQMLKRFEVDALAEAEPRIAERYRLAQWIGAEFDANQIGFAKAYLQAGCLDVRSFIGIGVGALEKIGLLPLVASTLVALAKMYESSQFATFWCAGAVVLLLFYLGAVKIIGGIQTIDRLVLVLSHAERYAAERSGRQPLNCQR